MFFLRGRKMNKEQRVNIKFWIKNSITATEMFRLLQKNICWRFSMQNLSVWMASAFPVRLWWWWGHEHEHRPKKTTNGINIEKMHEFVKFNKKCSVRFMEMELETAKVAIHHSNSKLVTHYLIDDKEFYRIQRCKNIVRKSRKNKTFLNTIVTGDETWCFQYDPETKCWLKNKKI